MSAALGLLFSTLLMSAEASTSVCYGSVSRGRLEGGVKLPDSGPNFRAYSRAGAAIGRTHVHRTVHDIAIRAYRTLERSAPGKVFVYGEGSWAKGGRIAPHRTHQNGLSLDFMVPVLDAAGNSVAIPASALNKFGYGIEFDAQGRSEGLRIDFDAIGEHLLALDRAARAFGSGLKLVIIDPQYLPKLFATRHGRQLQAMPFMRKAAWVRHDDHYHVDFDVACSPLDR